MNQEDGGVPHLNIGGAPEPEEVIEEVFILIATHPNGGEGIYGHKIEGAVQMFVAQTPSLKDAMENFLRNRGSVEMCRREGVKLEWVRFFGAMSSENREEIT